MNQLKNVFVVKIMSKKLTNEIVDMKIQNSNFIRIGNYINNQTKIDFKCKVCNIIHKIKPYSIFNGWNGCIHCLNKKFNNESIDIQLKNKSIKRIQNYINAKTPIKFKCLKCSFVWKTRPSCIIRYNHGCTNCQNRSKLNNKIIDTKLKFRKIQRLSPYKSTRSKMKFKCTICKNIWIANTNSVLNNGRGCPKCCLGKSEKNVMNLIKKYIKYDCLISHKLIKINNKKYFPDFYLEINNKKIIIEYNGEQHYKPVQFNGISKNKSIYLFKKQKIRDKIIKKYCNINNIILLEIPYFWKENKIIKTLTKLNTLGE